MKYVLMLLVVASTASADTSEVKASDTKAWLDVFDKIVDAVVMHRADCRTMAGDLEAIITVSQPTIRAVRDAKAAGKKLPQSAAQHMIDGSRRMIASLDKCGRDEKVSAAFARIDLGGRAR